MKKKILIITLIIVFIVFVFSIAFLLKFNFMNFTSDSAKPYLVKATVISQNTNEVTFSEIKPMVFFDATDVIAGLRNRGRDLSLEPFNDLPSSSSTFIVKSSDVPDVEVGQEIFLNYYSLDEKIELSKL